MCKIIQTSCGWRKMVFRIYFTKHTRIFASPTIPRCQCICLTHSIDVSTSSDHYNFSATHGMLALPYDRNNFPSQTVAYSSAYCADVSSALCKAKNIANSMERFTWQKFSGKPYATPYMRYARLSECTEYKS